MHDTEHLKRLHRGEDVHVDCSATQHISDVCYQERSPRGRHRCGIQTKKLEVTSQLPPSRLCQSASAQLSCTTSFTTTAAFAANAQARSSQVSGSVATNNPGATSTELEVTGRTYALLFKRFLQSKLRLGASHSRHKASFTSTAEAEVPALSQQLSCKANITTDFCRRVALQAELQWKARAQQASKRTLDVCKTGQSSLSSMTTKPHARHIDVQQHIDDNWQPQILCPVWVSQPKSPLPWRATPLPRPTPVYTHKQRATYGRGTEEKGERQNDAEQQGGFGRQCTLQIKGCPEGKPKPTWHLRMQESLGRKTQLRGRASALLTPVSFLPSKWQMEIRHRLPKGATFHAKLQGEDVQQPGHCSTSRHRLLLQRKARDAWWTCTCAHDSAEHMQQSMVHWAWPGGCTARKNVLVCETQDLCTERIGYRSFDARCAKLCTSAVLE
ncbi:hypothetical protein ABBQ32_002180 [Trebouxia sp. C0010 RCD-2024]